MNRIHCPELDNLFDWDKLYSINPKEIKWALVNGFEVTKNEWRKVYDGNWDEKININEDFVHSSVFQMLTQNIPFEQTSLCISSLEKIREGQMRWSCTTEEEFKKRGEHIINLFEKIKKEGFKTQEELDKTEIYSIKINNTFIDDPGVVIDKDGRYLYHNGNHRLPMFKILNIPEIKIKVNVRHKEWVDFLQYVYAVNEKIWGKDKTYQSINHIDFSHFKSEWSNYRIDIIKKNSFPESKTLLDIGALWGQFCLALETDNLKCTAVESNSSFSYIMNKIRIAKDKNFTIIKDNIFNLQNLNYDIVLALNIFHHFLKTKDTYEQLIRFLKQLKAKEMYFQTHNKEEAQMNNAYANFDKEEFVGFILDNSCFNTYKEIGEEQGRKIYKLWRKE